MLEYFENNYNNHILILIIKIINIYCLLSFLFSHKYKNTIKNKIYLNNSVKNKNIKLNIAKNVKVCLCTLGKKENNYIREFVEHYKKLGVDKIFLYDNNDLNDENFNIILNEYI